jgi:hypothetical protein
MSIFEDGAGGFEPLAPFRCGFLAGMTQSLRHSLIPDPDLMPIVVDRRVFRVRKDSFNVPLELDNKAFQALESFLAA